MIDSQTNLQPTPERVLDQTLRHLSTQPVPEGLEVRLLAHLTAASTAAPSPALHPLWSTLRRALLPSALTLAAAALLVNVTHHPHRPPAPVNTPRSLQSPQPAPIAARSPTQPTALPHSSHHTHPDPDAALALAETNAPSQLAPDLPLTADEQALQHLARHPNPEALNALVPSRVAAEQLAENAAFEAFFTKPAIPERTLKGENN